MTLISVEKPKTFEPYWPPPKSKIAVCMSGGVDSSTSAYILSKMGYEVVGLTGWLVKGTSRCCDNGMVDAAKVSEQIGIEHISRDLRIFFKQEIVDPFINSYASGSTPIPCITCNTTIKWGSLMQYALNELGCTHIATGHYAKLIKDNEIFKIVRSKDERKDQTYMLWGLTQEALSKTVFPLGNLTKDEVREIAKQGELVVAEKEESQDICFVNKKENTQDFLARYLPKKEGYIIENKTLKILGTHEGTQNYTIGQRKGLRIAHNEPLYVIKLDVDQNVVYVGTKEELEGFELIAKDVSWVLPEMHNHTKVMAKIRYNTPASLATIYPFNSNKVKVVFDEPRLAITSGQACVFYDEDDHILLGGGWIV